MPSAEPGTVSPARVTRVEQPAPESPHEAPVVPPDQPIIITIDGPAGTGKSTVARELAHRLGLDFLDTGSMYRAAAAIFLDHHFARDQVGELISTVIGADLHFDWSMDPPVVLAWDDPLEHRIRDADVTANVSWVASLGELRKHMVRKQRIIAAQHPRLVTEGRDQGSVVFPDAPVKFYLDADPEVRAQRRIEQLKGEGRDVDEAGMLERIVERDRLDSSRADGPLMCPDDAVVIDSTSLTIPQVIDRMERVVRERVPVIGAYRPSLD
ncbi:MAG: (d)CMP kinase [Phycisphaerales bacterium]